MTLEIKEVLKGRGSCLWNQRMVDKKRKRRPNTEISGKDGQISHEDKNST